MSLQETVSAQRLHIAFFGMRNAGKSSLVNAVTNQDLSVVSSFPGTTTDPVQKAMELLPIGPVVIIDTPGFDDVGELGALRVEKTKRILHKTDLAVLVVDSTLGLGEQDLQILRLFQEKGLPHLVAYNKADLLEARPDVDGVYVSAQTGEGVFALKERLSQLAPKGTEEKKIITDRLSQKDTVLLVTPIDESAPKGRLILPQQLTLRELLDHHCTVITCQDTEVFEALQNLKTPPALVITDSQAFGPVSQVVPKEIPLTSFSILFARYKGELSALIQGAEKLSHLRDTDSVLIAEGCTHHRQCNDIGTVKMPSWIQKFCGAEPTFHFTSGGTFPDDLTPYSLIVHCGGCMLNDAAMKHRIETATKSGVPLVNYGIAIAHMNGILKRSLEIFPELEIK